MISRIRSAPGSVDHAAIVAASAHYSPTGPSAPAAAESGASTTG